MRTAAMSSQRPEVSRTLRLSGKTSVSMFLPITAKKCLLKYGGNRQNKREAYNAFMD